MTQYYGCMLLQRVIFPIILTFCILFRPVLLSLPYLLLLFYLPFVPIANIKTIRGHTGYYFILTIVLSAIVVLLQIAFQIVLITLGDQFLGKCEFLEILFRHIGLIKFTDNFSIYTILEWCLPDVLLLLMSIIVFIVLRKIAIGSGSNNTNNTNNNNTGGIDIEGTEQNEIVQIYNFEEGYTPENFVFLRKLGVFIAMITLLLAAVLRPSVPGGIYFLVFLGAATWWACFKELEKGFAIVCRILLVFLAVHIIAFLSYQTPWPQEYLLPNNTIIRFLGFSELVISNCSAPNNDIRYVNFNDNVQADSYLNPVAILLCYYTLAIISGFLLNAKELEQCDTPSEPNERTPLMRRSMKKLKTFKQFQKKSSVPMEDADGIPLEEIPEEDLSPTILEHIYFGIGQFGEFIFKNSYILTNITMMVWSIVYHSWLTFVFLLWANLLWIIPNQRKNMLRCCPFIVIYAEFLLLAQYIYGMDLTEDELPSKTDMQGIKLSQIGFVRYDEFPCGPLLLKSVFTMIFWITLRQMTHEIKLQRQTSTLAHLAAPFQVTVSAATTDLGPKLEEKKSKLMMKAGALLKSLLVQLWIWIVMLALFLCAIYGKQMTAFRITYMALFLIFLITFQFSWRIWKRIMYPFLVIVIGYAMLTLIMIYTYQFDKFDEYWANYTGIQETLQHDIGLEQYETKDLFLHLVSPTFVVIITVVQLQYFHKKYLEIFNLPLGARRRENSESTIQQPSSINYGTLEPDNSLEDTKTKSNSKHFKFSDIKKITSKDVIAFISALYNETKWVIEIIWVFLEIHLIKVILLIGFFLGMKEVSVIHVSLILLATFGVTARTNIQTIFSRILSIVIGILLLLKMIYQIQYIHHNQFDYSCNETIVNETITSNVSITTNVTMANTTFNDADWVGFRKIDYDNHQTLATLLRGYFAYIFITTLHALILFRQKKNRYINGKPMTRPKIIFPRVTRQEADKDLPHMIKYLFNFAFYKFGIEITLMMIIALIGTRMDIIALFYAIWLCVLFIVPRETKARIWPLFKWFIVIFLLIQYIVVVGLPPSLCFDYNWSTVILRHLQEWAWLPDFKLRTQSNKLLLDFLLLLFTCRQLLVFRIEKRYEDSGSEFPGGSNKSVVEDINNLGKVPIISHDFITLTRNWLDIIKCGILLGLYWFALAIVFLTGTNRVNIFSIGYLIGSFIFLWQGAEFYLRPINVILKWWRYLLGYNIFVITCKTIFQIPGCIFIQELQKMCWAIQLFGVCCIRKFNKIDDDTYLLKDCNVPKEDIGLVWDGICFGFLLIQLRLFQSYYFCHIINEAKASTILASRGAELIEQLRKKQVKLQAQREEEILHKIKQKMDRIKANQQKFQPSVMQPKTHFQDDRPKKPLKRLPSHPNAVRSGDYYLFEDLDEKVELDLIHQRPSASVEDTLPIKRLSNRMTIDQVLDQKLKQQRRKLASDSSVERSQRRSSVPEEHEPTTKDPRSTVSEPITPADKIIISDLAGLKKDEFSQPDGQQPGTSRDATDKQIKDDLSEPTSSISDDEGEVSGLAFIRAFLSGVLVSITLKLYKLSRNYRYVTRVLTKEKKELKSEKDFGQGHRLGTGNVWTPLPSVLRSRGDASNDGSSVGSSTHRISSDDDKEINENDDDDDNTISKEESTSKKGEQSTTIAHLLRPTMFSTRDTKPVEDPRRTSVVPEIRILAPSMERGLDDSIQKYVSSEYIDSQKDISETDDDFYSQEHSILTELFTSIWFAMISNTDLICYLFVFIHMVASASLLALPIPFMVFLWGTLSVPRPSKTFWVTIIAYTQIVVLIKSICQFNLLWWNESQLTPNQPLAPARIIGVEKRQNFADYDLALLLVVFFHRFVQKQMGIWKTVSSDDELEGTYAVRKIENTETILPKTIVKQGDLTLALTKTEPGDDGPENGTMVHVSNVQEETSNYFPKVAALSTKKYLSSFTIFFKKLLKQTNRVTADVYVYIFLCDFINFFVLLFGFTAFGSTQGDGGVASYLTENKIPLAFLFMLLLQFVFIIVDRALYLRKNLAGKIVFQFISVIGMHIWLFFLVPVFSERSFNATAPPVIYYIVKCFYFLFSAYQIRCGYPRRILGNCLTKGFSILNLGAFKVYMATPFLFELRALMDWIWTDSSMPLFEWLKMEDIFANIYELKCSRQMEKKFPAPRGQAKGSFIKYIMGGAFLFAIIALVWGPLALFALGNTVGAPNIPYEIKVSLKIGSYEPLYIMGAQSSNIHQFNEQNWAALQGIYSKNRVALTFLSSYEYNDIAAVVLGANSTSLWMITPPDLERLKMDLLNNVTLKFRYKYSASRKTYNEKMAGTIYGDRSFDLDETNAARTSLTDMLNGKTTEPIVLPRLFPKFLKVRNLGDLASIIQLFPMDTDEDHMFRNLFLQMHTDKRDQITIASWWSVLEDCTDSIYKTLSLNDLPFEDCDNNLVLYTFSDKLFPETLSFLTAGGVISLYTTFVFVMSRFFRGFFAGGCQDIMYSELPCVDRILQLCLDIYLVRESMEFDLEEDLFAKLIFVYRSPETMIRWTRPIEEQSSDEDDDEDEDATEEEKSLRRAQQQKQQAK